MSEPKAHVCLLIDVESLSRAGIASPATTLVPALLRYAAGVGRLVVARAYADWTATADAARAFQAARVEPVLVTAGPAGEDRAHVRLTVDALEALFAGGEPEAFLLVTADARLLPLVQALRADGSDVLLVVPAAVAAPELRAEVDVVATVEDVLAGAVGPASAPRPVDADDDATAGADDEDELGDEAEDAPAASAPPARPVATPVRPAPRTPSPEGRGFGPPPGGRAGTYEPRAFGRESRERGGARDPRGPRDPRNSYRDDARAGDARGGRAFGGPGADRGFGPSRGGREGGGPGGFREAAPADFAAYDWSGFVRLIDDLEHRLPFVGVRYLVNKVMGPRNCGIDDPRAKRELINRAVDEGILEMYEVGNVDGRGDPVTACRLDRKSPLVGGQIGGPPRAPVASGSRFPGADAPAGDGGPVGDDGLGEPAGDLAGAGSDGPDDAP